LELSLKFRLGFRVGFEIRVRVEVKGGDTLKARFSIDLDKGCV
jgi:hypothetical protein